MTIPEAHPISGDYPIVDASTWRAKRPEHLPAEKAFTSDDLSGSETDVVLPVFQHR